MSAIPTPLRPLFQRLKRSQADSSSSENTPTEPAALPALGDTATSDAHTGALCARCRRALRRNGHKVRAGRARARIAQRDERGRFLPRNEAALLRLSVPLALILSFVIQGCAASSTSVSQPNTPFDAYEACTHNLPPPQMNDTGYRDCFKQTIDANHLALPAGIAAEQAYAKYKGCINQGHVSIGPFVMLGPHDTDPRQDCFTSALQ